MNKINKLSKKDYESLIKELIEAYDTYVKVLEVENGSLVGFAYTHGWRVNEIFFYVQWNRRI